MMTNQEFLNGIYAKAETAKRAEEQKIRPGAGKTIKILVPVMTICLIMIAAIPISLFSFKKTRAPEVPQGVESVALTERMALPVEPLFLIVEGTVLSAEATDGVYLVDITIEEAYQGELSGKLSFIDKGGSGFTYEKGEKGLFYLVEEEAGYVLSNGDYGKYRYVKEENGEKLYEAKDGSQLSSGILRQE